MKKLFLFFAAMLVALAANATIWQITPTSPREKDNIRYCLRDNAQAGDTILLTTDDSPYGESDAIAINKSIVIMPAEGKHPVVNLTYYTKLSAGAIAKIVGLKFDGQGTCEYAFRPYDNSASAVTFDGCEFTGFTKYVITSSEGNHTDSCIINNCYFHDNGRAAVYFPACNLEDATINTVDYVRVTNSTITNITGLNTAIIDVRNHNQDYTENIRLEVDHCTFYNWVGGTNGAIMSYKSPLSSVTNCIFAEPEETAYYASYCYGGIVKNCLAYNVAGHRDWDTHPQMADNIVGNPLFVNASEGNLTLGEGSPALTAAADGGAIGDPRWVPAAPAPTTKTIYLNDGVWADADAARYEVYCITNESWVTLTAVADTNNLYSAEIPETVTQVVYCRMDPTKPEGEWSSLQNQTEDLTIPDGKDLFTITGWGDGWGANCVGLWSKYGEEPVAPLENGFYLVGKFGGVDAWDYASLSADKKFEWNKTVGEGNEEWKVMADLVEGDKVKACYVYNGAITEYFPSGEGNEYVVDAYHTGKGKTIYFQQLKNEDWGGHFYIEANKPEVTYSDFEIVLYEGQLGTDKDNPNNAYLTVSGELYKYSQEMPLAYNAYLTSANYNGAQHGYTNLVVTMPVEAGNYKVTLGTCQYGNGAGSIKKADDSETYKTFNQNIGEGKNYKTNPAEYIVSTVFSVAEAQMIKIVCGNYTPYIKVEQVTNIEYAVTFAVEEGVRGIVPAPVAIVKGESLTIPANTTLYLDGHTLTGWTDGENTYAPGDVFTPEADATLTAVFAENTASLLTATVPVTVQWNFGLTEGAPTVAWEGENKGMGFLVAQATIGETKVDVPLDVDARSGKFANSGRKDYWAQVNAGAKLYFPAKKGAEVEVFTYADPATTTVDKATQTGTWTDNKSQFITTATIDASIMEVQENSYYRYLKVTYPASEATAISNTGAEVKAQKVIENGQIFILKNGVKYNVLGASVK